MQKQKGFSWIIGIITIAIIVIIAVGGFYVYKYFNLQGEQGDKKSSVSVQENKNSAEFNFNISGKNIEIKNSEGVLVQQIPLSEELDWDLHNPASIYKNLTMKDIVKSDNDVNFDSYKDLQILTSIPGDNPGHFDFYLYNPISGKFEKDNRRKLLIRSVWYSDRWW